MRDNSNNLQRRRARIEEEQRESLQKRQKKWMVILALASRQQIWITRIIVSLLPSCS